MWIVRMTLVFLCESIREIRDRWFVLGNIGLPIDS